MTRPKLWFASVLCVSWLGCADDSVDPQGGGGGGTGGATTIATSGGGADPGCEILGCQADSFCFEDACVPCDTTQGSVRNAEMDDADSDGQTRQYFLHVPQAYSCATPSALLVDFHGTATGDEPEIAYQNDAIVELSESESVLVVRPRSLSSIEGGFEIFRWDQNPGDLARNSEYAKRLVRHLSARFRIDPNRIYASGFSSGANMTAQFFSNEHRGLFRGLAPIAGGLWGGATTIGAFNDDGPRAYFATGYRDYLYPSLRELQSKLTAAGLPDDRQFVRHLDTGHELYEFEFAELYAWLDRGEREQDEPGSPLAPWQTEAVPSEAAILTLDRNGTSLWGTDSDGSVLARDMAGSWSVEQLAAQPVAWVGACSNAAGQRFLVGEGKLQRDLGAGLLPPQSLPELGQQTFGFTYGNGVGCGANQDLAIAGYWSGLSSVDAGQTFTDLQLEVGGYEAQGAAVRSNTNGTSVLLGYYNYVARRGNGDAAPVPRPHQVVSGWWTDAVAGPNGLWLACGDSGAVIRSTDDGQSWLSTSSPTSDPLYAMAISPNGLSVVAVGHRGQVSYSRDAGLTWALLPTGKDGMLSAAVFTDDDTVLVSGEQGTMLRATLP